jgi:Uncharacterized protein conserved in bacteria
MPSTKKPPLTALLTIVLAIVVLLSLAAYLLVRTSPLNEPTLPNQTAAPAAALESPLEKPIRPAVQRILFAGDSMMQGIAPLMMRELKATHPDWLLRTKVSKAPG